MDHRIVISVLDLIKSDLTISSRQLIEKKSIERGLSMFDAEIRFRPDQPPSLVNSGDSTIDVAALPNQLTGILAMNSIINSIRNSRSCHRNISCFCHTHSLGIDRRINSSKTKNQY
jgi:hypothetical protein